jgi:hypothetical protein
VDRTWCGWARTTRSIWRVEGLTSSKFNMAHFDALPKAVRVALANANHNWNCSQVRRVMTARSKKKKRFTSAEIIDVVRTRDNKLTARYYDALSRGERLS